MEKRSFIYIVAFSFAFSALADSTTFTVPAPSPAMTQPGSPASGFFGYACTKDEECVGVHRSNYNNTCGPYCDVTPTKCSSGVCIADPLGSCPSCAPAAGAPATMYTNGATELDECSTDNECTAVKGGGIIPSSCNGNGASGTDCNKDMWVCRANSVGVRKCQSFGYCYCKIPDVIDPSVKRDFNL